MRIYFPQFYTEAHRTTEHQANLVAELSRQGIECSPEMTNRCKLILCGSIYCYEAAAKGWLEFAPVPMVHYNWDIYPFQLENPDVKDWWAGYITELKRCREVLVPSRCTVQRTLEFTGRSAEVVKAPIHPWEPSAAVTRGNYVLDVMRKYPDPNKTIVREVCEEIGMPLVETQTETEWEEFKNKVSGARFLVSPNYEASTGGLTLLEGYWHGKNVLLSNSPRNGGIDYFGHRARYFQWDDREDLKKQLRFMWDYSLPSNISQRRAWINRNYSETAFASSIATRISRILING